MNRNPADLSRRAFVTATAGLAAAAVSGGLRAEAAKPSITVYRDPT